MSAHLHLGDCLAWLATLEAESVDSIVTDPPYGLGFMGKAWDALPPGREWAEACFRVLACLRCPEWTGRGCCTDPGRAE